MVPPPLNQGAKSCTGDEGEEDDPLSSIIRSQRVLLRGLVRSVRKADGMTLQQSAILRILARDGATTMKKLSEELLVTPPNITGIVDRLEEKGIVARVASKEDRRKKEITLTTEGERRRQEIVQDYRESLGGSLSVLTNEERSTLAILLKKLAEVVECSKS